LNRTDNAFGANCFASGLSSGEGLIARVRDPVTEMTFKKGAAVAIPAVVDAGIEDKRLCVVEAEFSRVLKVASGQTNILTAVIRDAWDTGNLDNLTKNNRTKATGAHIGIIGHITKEEVTRLLTNTEAANGFGNRFLWLYTRRSKSLPFGGSLLADALDGIRQGLLDAENGVYPGLPALALDEAAATLWAAGRTYEELSSGRPGLVGALVGRAAPQVVRLALIFALLDCKRSISVAHLKAALAIWKYCEASARFVFGESLGDDTADEIHGYLRTVGLSGATRTDISKLFNRNKASAEISRALGALARHSLARCVVEQTGGGPAERWFLWVVGESFRSIRSFRYAESATGTIRNRLSKDISFISFSKVPFIALQRTTEVPGFDDRPLNFCSKKRNERIERKEGRQTERSRTRKRRSKSEKWVTWSEYASEQHTRIFAEAAAARKNRTEESSQLDSSAIRATPFHRAFFEQLSRLPAGTKSELLVADRQRNSRDPGQSLHTQEKRRLAGNVRGLGPVSFHTHLRQLAEPN
jgi:hypothetical protein